MKYKNIALSIATAAAVSSAAFAGQVPADAVIFDKITASSDSGNVTITGNLKPSLNYTNLSINSNTATITDNKFSVTLPAASNYDLVLVDANSNSTSLTYKSSDTVVNQALQAVVGDALLKGIGPAAGTLLTDLDLMKVAGLSPTKCIVDTWLLWGCDMYITEAFLGGKPDLALGFEDTGSDELTVNADISLPQVVLNTKLKRAWWWGYDYIRLDVRDTDVKAQITARATENEGLKIVLDEPSDVNLQIGQINVQSNNLLARLIPYFRTAITSIVNSHLVDIAGPILAKYEIKNIPLDLPLDLNADGKNDAEFAINLGFNKFDVVGSDDGLVRLSANMKSKTVKEGRDAIGSRFIGPGYYAEEGVTAPTAVKASLLQDFANQLLLAVYQSGLDESLNIKLRVDQMGNFGALFGQAGFTGEDMINIAIGFGSLPELVLKANGKNPATFDVSLPNATVSLASDRIPFDNIPKTEDGKGYLLEFDSNIMFSISLGVNSDGSLAIDFPNLLAVSNVNTTGGFFREGLESIIDQVVTAAFPTFGNAFEGILGDFLKSPSFKLDMGELLNGAIKDANFPSVPVTVGVTEADVDNDEKFLDLGIGVKFGSDAQAASSSAAAAQKRYINENGQEFEPLNFEDMNHPCYYDNDYSRCYNDLSMYEKYLK